MGGQLATEFAGYSAIEACSREVDLSGFDKGLIAVLGMVKDFNDTLQIFRCVDKRIMWKSTPGVIAYFALLGVKYADLCMSTL